MAEIIKFTPKPKPKFFLKSDLWLFIASGVAGAVYLIFFEHAWGTFAVYWLVVALLLALRAGWGLRRELREERRK